MSNFSSSGKGIDSDKGNDATDEQVKLLAERLSKLENMVTSQTRLSNEYKSRLPAARTKIDEMKNSIKLQTEKIYRLREEMARDKNEFERLFEQAKRNASSANKAASSGTDDGKSALELTRLLGNLTAKIQRAHDEIRVQMNTARDSIIARNERIEHETGQYIPPPPPLTAPSLTSTLSSLSLV